MQSQSYRIPILQAGSQLHLHAGRSGFYTRVCSQPAPYKFEVLRQSSILEGLPLHSLAQATSEIPAVLR